MRVVVALGGNALLRRGEALDAAAQRAQRQDRGRGRRRRWPRTTRSCSPTATARRSGCSPSRTRPTPRWPPIPSTSSTPRPRAWSATCSSRSWDDTSPASDVATLLTQIVVDPTDLAFTHPTKFVGPLYDEPQAHALTHDRGWAMARDGERWRRVVPSPEPVEIVELSTIRLLVDQGVTVICSGGGGIPVTADGAGGLRGVEAVIDKDLAAALLARGLGADALLLLTDVDGVYQGFGTESARLLRRMTVDQVRAMDLPAGSMGPKVDACCRFVEQSGGVAAIGALADAEAVLAGEAGTTITA